MDGLLMDTREVITRTLAEVIQDLGFTAEPELVQSISRLSEIEIAARLREQFGETFVASKFREHFEFNLEQKFEKDVPVKPGVFDFLVLLHRRKIPSLVVAANRTVAAQTRLSNAKILRYVQGVAGCDLVRKQKPAPDIFAFAAREMGSKPEQCLAVECDEVGIRAAHAAGMIPILVADNYDPSDEIRGITRQICTSLGELSKVLQRSL